MTSFAPGSTQLVGTVIKVHGRMRASAGRSGNLRVLRVRLDYLFVYPVEQPGRPSTLIRVVVRQVAAVNFARWPRLSPRPAV